MCFISVQEMVCSQRELDQRALCLEVHGHVPEDVQDSLQDSAAGPSALCHPEPIQAHASPATLHQPTAAGPLAVATHPAAAAAASNQQHPVGAHSPAAAAIKTDRWPVGAHCATQPERPSQQAGPASQGIGPHTHGFLQLRLTQGAPCTSAHLLTGHPSPAAPERLGPRHPECRPADNGLAPRRDAAHPELGADHELPGKVSYVPAVLQKMLHPAPVISAACPGNLGIVGQQDRGGHAMQAILAPQRGPSQAWLGGGSQAGSLNLQFSLTQDGHTQEEWQAAAVPLIPAGLDNESAHPMPTTLAGGRRQEAGAAAAVKDVFEAGRHFGQAQAALRAPEALSWLQQPQPPPRDSPPCNAEPAYNAKVSAANDSEPQLELQFTLPSPSQELFQADDDCSVRAPEPEPGASSPKHLAVHPSGVILTSGCQPSGCQPLAKIQRLWGSA